MHKYLRLKNGFRRYLLSGVLCIFLPSLLMAQSFGKNKVQYREFDWEYLQSKHFDVYYYEGGRQLAEFVADVAETSYVHISRDLGFLISKRVPLLVYNSHNHFEQTNVSLAMLEEGVEGFTEVFKDRVVLQFRGGWEELRHLTEHELTHAVTLQMLYGKAMGSRLTSMARMQLPLWMMEGLAEYESSGWNAEADMFMRDATINGYLPPIDYLYGNMAYKGGQSVMNYLAETYGAEKIGEFFNKSKMHHGFDEGLKQSIGLNSEELTKKWHQYLRKRYWPDIEKREPPEDIATRLTDHKKEKVFLNNSPSLSPKGDKLVYLSNRSDYIDIHMLTTFDGKDRGRIVKGQRSEIFEELHWTRPGMSWSPDGKQIVFAAKAGDQDALYTVDIIYKEITGSYKLGLEGIHSPSWSPDGEAIVFMGIQHGQSDLYLFMLATAEVRRLTDDVFSDMDPTWSSDGREIAFISDRRSFLGDKEFTDKIADINYSQTDLFSIDIETGTMTRHTDDAFLQTSPAWSPDGRSIAYVSDESGIANIYMFNRDIEQHYPITNLLSGVQQLSWSREGSRIAFSSFYDGGYDIYMISNPLDIESGSIEIEPTRLRTEDRTLLSVKELKVNKLVEPGNKRDFADFVFSKNMKEQSTKEKEKEEKVFLDTLEYKDALGEYKQKKYKIKFTPDMISGGAGYNQFFGLQGSTLIGLSDILGNHQIQIYTDIFYNIKNSNFQFSYFYLPKQTDYGISLFHYSNLYYSYFDYVRDRTYGISLMASRPFDRYRRMNFGASQINISRDWGIVDPYGFSGEYMKDMGNLFSKRLLTLNLGYSTDTVVWGWTGPVNGERSSFSVNYSPQISKSEGLSFWTMEADWRKYFKLKRDYTFVVRFAGGISNGKHAQRFLVGGMQGWINYKYASIPNDYWNNNLFYFSRFVAPLRGSLYYDMIGTRFCLANLEVRFPFIQYLILGGPLKMGFQNIRGAIFLDMGSAWSNDKAWKPFDQVGDMKMPLLNDMKAGYGFGIRANLGFFLLKYDVAWSTNFHHTTPRPVQYFTMGAEF
ncbi:PD40 domain-containing protein [bacterium]|nr:PD40 domain-containing protein [bacterium]